MAANTKNTAAVAALPSKEQFIAQYLADKANPHEKVGLIDRFTTFVGNRVVDTIADSTRIAGRISAAASAAGDGYHMAAALEHARQAERAANRLGLS